MIRKILFPVTIFAVITSCGNQAITKEELNANKEISSGEWISFSDSLSGLSVRKHKMAFYKNNRFEGDDICDFVIIDSVKFEDNKKTVLSTYLKTYCFEDTIYYEVTNMNDKDISLTLKDNKTESYRLQE